MPEETVVAAPPVGGVSQGSDSQGSVPTSQDAGQNQPTGDSQVESGQPTATRQDPGRPKPSEFYKIRQLEREIRELKGLVTQNAQARTETPVSTPSVPQIDPNEFYKDPIAWQLKREAQIRQEIERDLFDKKIPEFFTRKEQESDYKRRSQEALELLFPKSSPTSMDALPKRLAADPDRAERMMDLLRESGLDKLSESEPIKAASLALELYQIRYPAQAPRSQNAIKKSQMAGTATGSPVGGGSKMPTLQELTAEKDQLMNQVKDKGPGLFKDEKFMTRFNFVKEELAKLNKPG